jgi:hypothetical protein
MKKQSVFIGILTILVYVELSRSTRIGTPSIKDSNG